MPCAAITASFVLTKPPVARRLGSILPERRTDRTGFMRRNGCAPASRRDAALSRPDGVDRHAASVLVFLHPLVDDGVAGMAIDADGAMGDASAPVVAMPARAAPLGDRD